MADNNAAALGDEAAQRLVALGTAEIARGLTDDEFARVETTFGFEFADDHRAFLAAGLPKGPSWPDWRSENHRPLRTMLGWPVEGALFDIEFNDFWDDRWGSRPAGLRQAVQVARRKLDRLRQMVPVFAQHYLPAGRGTFGRPVLSMQRMAIAPRGADLTDYIDREFDTMTPRPPLNAVSTVEFWSDHF